MRVLACLIHTEKQRGFEYFRCGETGKAFSSSFEEAFSLPVPLIMYVVAYLKKKK